jgi:hypothetical protein
VEVAEGVKDFLPQNVMRTPRPAVITATSFPGDRPNLSGNAAFHIIHNTRQHDTHDTTRA